MALAGAVDRKVLKSVRDLLADFFRRAKEAETVRDRNRMHSPREHLDLALGSAGGLRPRWVALLFAVVMIAVAIPILAHPLPPISDYINHLATDHVVDVIDRDPDLSRFYRIEWEPIPDLMMDLVVPLLHRFVSIYLAGQIFFVATFVGILSGVLLVNRALFGRWSALPLLAGLFVYNGVLLVGVMNYTFGIGLSLWGFAAWVAMRERSWPLRLAVSTVIVMAIFFCHLYALGLYGLQLLAFELHRLWVRRREGFEPVLDFVATGLPFLPALALLLAGPTGDSAGVPAYWDLSGKLDGLTLAITMYYPEIAYGFVAALALAAALVWRRGLLHVHPLGGALLAVGGIIYLSMPRAIFAAHLADQRLPIALLFMLIACIDVDLDSSRLRAGFVALLGLLLAVRLGEVELVWDDLTRGQVEALHAVPAIKRGARVLVAYGDRAHTGLISDLGLVHIASLATIERSALVSTAFTVEGKHILQVRRAFRPFVDTRDGTPPSLRFLAEAARGPGPYYFSDWPHHYDYVLILFTNQGAPDPDPARLAIVNEGRHFQLYRVNKPG